MDKKDLNIKQVLVVRKDLNMRKGKIAAQCSHASVGILMKHVGDEFREQEKFFSGPSSIDTYGFELTGISPEMYWWMKNGTKKICVSVDSEAELNNIWNEAGDFNLPRYMVTDSGLTEFNGVKTKTVLAIGPAEGDIIDLITGKLKLM